MTLQSSQAGSVSVPASAASSHPTSAEAWRTDIQVLRGLAVSLVVIEHAKLPVFPGGFLGVDIFFVISGYLMTKIILADLDRARFSFSAFYARRARRLLPGAYATIIVTALLAPLMLDPVELAAFVQQVGGSFTFVVNVILWKQTDYFGSGAALKPLLHMWSLAVEEQYYLLLPAMLFILPARWRLSVSAALVIVSLVACFVFVQRSPSAVFYFLPFRAWELGIGSLVAFLVRAGIGLPCPVLLRAAASALLVVIPALVDQRDHPGTSALTVCLATAIVILAGPPGTQPRILVPLAWIGDRSYSLYLVHWPVFAFANNIVMGPLPLLANLLLLPVVLISMELQYRLVEQRWRGMAINRRSFATLVCIPIVLMAWLHTLSMRQSAAVAASEQGRFGFGAACIGRDKMATDRSCRSAEAPTTLIWGDSFALPLVSGLANVLPGGVVQATKPVCGPFLDIAPVNGADRRLAWAEDCRSFNRSVLAHLAAHPEIRTVVLTSAFAQYVPDAEEAPWRLVSWVDGKAVEGPSDLEKLESGLERTLEEIRKLGRKTVVVAPPPRVNFDAARCLRRLDRGLPIVAPLPDCTFTTEAYRSLRGPIIAAMERLVERRVPLISFEQAICGDEVCRTRANGTMLYLDMAHLSGAGVELLAQEMNMPRLIEQTAK